jgi:hypothetical protein
MSAKMLFWIIFLLLTALVIFCDIKYGMLKDISKASPAPFSWSRVQLALWSIIILASFGAILIHSGAAPELNESTLILLGISGATTAAARAIDVSDINNPLVTSLSQDQPGVSFFLDILSDKSGISIHRFQTVAFNFVFGAWFITYVLGHIGASPINDIMPVVADNNLVLLGLSSATYAAVKTTENQTNQPSTTTPDEEAVG